MDKRDGRKRTNADQKWWIELSQINTWIGIIIDNRAELEKKTFGLAAQGHISSADS